MAGTICAKSAPDNFKSIAKYETDRKETELQNQRVINKILLKTVFTACNDTFKAKNPFKVN
jgi:hypothetical protein